jgi:hypothetical protein
MDTKHTPGPWVVRGPGSVIGHSNKCVVQNNDHFDWVAQVQVSNMPEWEANAKLIASAPELLKALIELHNLLDEHEPNWYLKKHDNLAINAIKKATE